MSRCSELDSTIVQPQGWHWRLAALALLFLLAQAAHAFRADEDAAAAKYLDAVTPPPPVPARPLSADQLGAKTLADQAGVQIEWHPEMGTPLSIRGPALGQPRTFSGGKGLLPRSGEHGHNAVAVMDTLARFYRLRDAEAELAVKRVEQDSLGFTHVRLTQQHQKLRVVGGELLVHFNANSEAYEVNGQYVPDLEMDVKPKLDADAAVLAAVQELEAMGKPGGQLEAGPELVVFARETEPQLAYELTILITDTQGIPGRWRYWIEANAGAVLHRYNDIKKIAAPTTNGTNAPITGAILSGEGGQVVNVVGWFENTGYYYLYNTNRRWYVYNVDSASYPDSSTYAYRTNASWSTSDRVEMSTARNFDFVQRYFLEAHGRSSFNNAGIYARANVHEGQNYVNAYWNGSAFYFGDGDGSMANPLAVLDVCGHEYAHAVTEYTADLLYSYESGALNESFSDIFGAAIEFYAQTDGRALYPSKSAGTADWLCAEDSWLSSTALRDMRNPRNTSTVGAGNEQPSRYKGSYWYSGGGDNGGVHYNSGVQNFFFYLLSEGGSGNNDGINYTVTGIGITNAARIAYRALTVYCTASTDYQAVRGAWLSAAMDLNPNWAASVSAAWSAVGIGPMQVNPASALMFRGPVGGPFAPVSQAFALANRGSLTLNWSVSAPPSWLALSATNGTLGANASNSVNVSLAAVAAGLPMGIYTNVLNFSNSLDATVLPRQVILAVGQPTYFAELFDAGDNDLDFQSWTFTPNGSPDFYAVCRTPATNFPTLVAGGTAVSLSDDSYVQVTLTGTNTVAIYSRRTNVFFIGSNGYLTMNSGDSTLGESFASHFSLPRVSACFDDLYPSSGSVTWKQTAELVAVTFSNVVEYSSSATVNFQIEMFYDGRIRVTYLSVGITDGLAGLSAGTGVPVGFTESDLTSFGACTLPLFVSAPASTNEGAGLLAGAGTILLAAPLATNLPVTLTASLPDEISVSNLVVPAGQTNVAFNLFVLDDALLDGSQPVVITASASGFATAQTIVTIHDNETAMLNVSLPASAREGDVSVPGVVSVSAVPGRNVAVALSSSDLTEVVVPAWVTIPAGQTSAVFNATVVNDTQIDGAQPASVTARVQNWTDGSAVIIVQDNEPLTLTVTLPASAYESAGVLTNAGSVSLSGTLAANLAVSLSSGDATELAVPATVVIPSNQFSVTFNLTMVDDALVDGAQSVTVTAAAVGFTNGASSLQVLDDESPAVPTNPSPAHLAVNVTASSDLSWASGALPGQVITNDVYFGTNPTPGPAELLGSTTSANWLLPQLAPLTTYYWQVVARRIGVTPGPVWQFTTRGVDHFDWSAIASPQWVGTNFAAAVTARDEFNSVVSNFTGSVALNGWDGSLETALFQDDFEDGSFSDWTIGSASATRAITNDTAAGGSRSLTIVGGTAHYQGLSHTLSNLTPGRIDFHVRASATNDAGGYFVVANATDGASTANSNTAVFFHMSGAAGMGLYEDTGGARLVPYTSNQWYKISLLLNWGGRRVDYYVNDVVAYTNVPFRGSVSNLTILHLYNFSSTRSWWDEIRFSGGNLASPVAITPASSGNFVNGAWSGGITVLQPAANMFLTATDNAGHRGTSANFEARLANDLTVTAADQPDPVLVSAPLTNLITVANTGPSPATGVNATNFLPSSVAFVSATASQGSCVLVGDRVECAIGTLAGGASASIRVVTTPNVTGLITNRVTAGRLESDANPTNNSATSVTTVRLPSLTIADASVTEGNAGTNSAVFSVTLQPASPLPVTVNYSTTNGTAQSGSDYLSASGTLNFAPGETNKTLAVMVLGDTDAEPAETFLVILSNPVNALLARAQATGTILTDDNGEPPPFQIAGLFTNNSRVVDHDVLTGDDRGGIAVSATRAFVTGDSSTALFNVTDLTGGTSLGVVRDTLCSDLRTETVYLLGNGSTPLTSSGGTVTTLIELNGNTGQPTGVVLPLSQSFTMTSYSCGIFSGFGRVVVHTGTRVYDIYVPSGFVTDRGAMTRPYWYSSESWVICWGVAESFGGALYLTARESGTQRIIRSRVPDGAVTPVATFSSLSDLASFTVSPSRNRWYFHHESSSQFGGTYETLGYADATFISTNPPLIVAQPQSQVARSGTNVTFCVTAVGSVPLIYQWRKDGTNLVNGGRISGATNACLNISNLATADAGQYSVLVANAHGFALSSNATLLVSELDRFVWGTMPSQVGDQMPFAAILTARSSANILVTNYNGCVTLRGVSASTNTVGTGTTTFNFPMGTYYHDERTQVIYQPGEVGGPGRITALALDVSTRPTQTMNFWTIRMKHTPLSSYTNYQWESTGWTVVYQTNLSVSSTGLITFNLSTPFDYNGADSLMVDFSFNNSSYTSDGYCRASARSGTRTLYARTDSGYGDPLTWSGNTPYPSTSTYTPNLRLIKSDILPVDINPNVICLTNGVWAGDLAIRVPTPPTTLNLMAEDGLGHMGVSTPIRINPTPPAIVAHPTNLIVQIGDSATFCVTARGSSPLRYYWMRDGLPIPGSGSNQTCFTLAGVQFSDSGSQFSCRVSNAYGAVLSAAATLKVNRPPFADASATPTLVIAPNNVSARTVLDGSRSFDPDGDPLQCVWFGTNSPAPLATGMVAVVLLPVGVHPIDLVVGDGMVSDVDHITVTVLTPPQAVQRLIQQVKQSGWTPARPLIAILEAAHNAITRGDRIPAINQLHAFQVMVRAQVAPENPTLAEAWIRAAQEIIDSLCGAGTSEVAPSLHVAQHEPGGKLGFKVNAAACWLQVVEASTDMVNWEAIGVPVMQLDGSFSFEDPNAARFPVRYYRLKQMPR